LHPNTAEHRAFAQQQMAAIQQLQTNYAGLDFSAEMAHFEEYCS
jgi:hypothetical protein